MAKIKKNSYHLFYPKDISPLYHCKKTPKFEEEKEIKHNNFCSKCGYQKHFGNEKNCPICVTLKEHNQLREEDLSNIKYYYPFKDKYETNSNLYKNIRNRRSSFNNIFNMNSENGESKTFSNPYCINKMFINHNYKRKKLSDNKLRYKRNKHNRSNTTEKFDVLERYFG